jgi:hypothetical protein
MDGSGDPGAKQPILDYNEDDCLATDIAADGIRGLHTRVKLSTKHLSGIATRILTSVITQKRP